MKVMRMLLSALILAGIAGAQAQESGEPKADATMEPAAQAKDDKHIFGVVPNYMAVNDPTRHYEPISPKEKFVIAAHDTFDPFNWVITGIYAGVAQWGNNYAQYGQGAGGYAKRYGAAFADGAISSYLSEGVLPVLLHQDPRYFRMGKGSAWHRAGYAMSRVLVTRTDAGGSTFNTSEIGGNLIAASMQNLYYPPANRNLSSTIDKFTVNVVSDAGFNVLREFWPDMRRKILHKGEPEPLH